MFDRAPRRYNSAASWFNLEEHTVRQPPIFGPADRREIVWSVVVCCHEQGIGARHDVFVEIQVARLVVYQRCHGRIEVELNLSIFIVQEHGLPVAMAWVGRTSGVPVREREVSFVAISLGFEVGSGVVFLVHED